jgi:hypothetical protein
MSNPTSNFGWQMPTSTDLVTDLPADFEVFGQAVDTSLADLKGGTTGQVLKKNSNTDMDFVWSADSAGMTNPMTTTGDTIYSSSGSTPARLGIGSTGQVLTVSGGVPTWAAAGSGKTWSLLSTTSMSGSSSITVSGISNVEDILVLVVNSTTSGTSNNGWNFRINGDTGAKYSNTDTRIEAKSTYAANQFNGYSQINGTYVVWGFKANTSTSQFNGSVILSGCKSTAFKNYSFQGGATHASGNGQSLIWGQGVYNATAAVSSITVFEEYSTNFSGGTIYVYGA